MASVADQLLAPPCRSAGCAGLCLHWGALTQPSTAPTCNSNKLVLTPWSPLRKGVASKLDFQDASGQPLPGFHLLVNIQDEEGWEATVRLADEVVRSILGASVLPRSAFAAGSKGGQQL